MAAGGYCHVLFEQTSNGPGAENRAPTLSTIPFYLPASEIGWDTPPVTDDRSDELRGTFETLPQDVVGFDPTALTPINLRLYPNVAGIPISLCIGAPVTTAGNGVITDPDGATIPTGATRHVWDSASIPAAVRSAQFQLGYTDQAAFWKLKGVTGTQFNITHDGRIARMEATLAALYAQNIADPSLTPSYDAPSVLPFISANHSIPAWLAASGTPTNINYSLAAPVVHDYSFGQASKFPDIWDRTTPPQLTATLTLRNVDVDDWLGYINQTQFTVKSKWLHTINVGATTYKYQMWIEGNAQYLGTTVESLKHQIKLGATIPVSFGKGAGSAFKITIVNAVASYSSVA